MVARIVKWVSLTALVLMVAPWLPSASYQLPLGFLVLAGAVVVVLALFFIKYEIETHVDNGFNPARRVTVKL